ncbi:hypothetical protein EV714DRAFT_252736 [Schizophyllum commune]
MPPSSPQGPVSCVRDHPPDEVCEECSLRDTGGQQVAQQQQQVPTGPLSAMFGVAKGISALAQFLRTTGVYGKAGSLSRQGKDKDETPSQELRNPKEGSYKGDSQL